MRHRKFGRTLGRNPNHQRALLKNLAIALIFTEKDPKEYDTEAQAPKVKGRIITTLIKAKEVKPFIEKCITMAVKEYKAIQEAKKLESKAEKGSTAWKSWREGDGWKEWVVVASKALAYRRRIVSNLGSQEAAVILTERIAPRFEERPGGYTRIVKLAKPRLGDAGPRAILEFVNEADKRKKAPVMPKVED